MRRVLFFGVLLMFLKPEVGFAQNILTFEQPTGTKSWTENGLTWAWGNGSDEIQQGTNAKNGSGYARAMSASNSKLVFAQALNLNSLWIRFTGGATIMYSTIKGYDVNNNVIYEKVVSNNFSYQNITLNWTNVRSIAVEVPYELMPDPMNPSNYIQYSFNAYYDDLDYSIYTAPVDTTPPTIYCLSDVSNCGNITVGNYASQVMVMDNVSSSQNIQVTQSIPVGTVINTTTLITLTATDQANNSASCSFYLRVNSPTTSTQNITSNTSYKDPTGQFHYTSGSFSFITPNSKGCDSTVNINLTINQELGILDFDVEQNLSSWNEDSKSWFFSGGTDKIGNGSSAKRGIGYGKTLSGSGSKLTFPEPINLQNIWVKFTGGPMAFSSTIFGYDEQGNVLGQQTINQGSNYQQITLNWSNVSAIGFNVPYAQMWTPGFPTPMTYPVELTFDDLSYSYSAPNIVCPTNKTLCAGTALPNYSNLVTINGASNSMTLVQQPIAGTNFTTQTTVTFSLKEGNTSVATCTFNVLPLQPTTNTLNVSVCNQYVSPLGVTYTSSQTIIEKIPNAVGCDSTITIHLTINPSKTHTVSYNATNQYTYNNTTYYSSTILTQHLLTSKGCDSTVTININITSDYLTLDFNEATGTSSWSEDGYSWSGWTISSDMPKSGIGNALASAGFMIDSQSAAKLVAHKPMDVQGFWLKTFDGINITEAKVFGYDASNNLKNQLTIPSSYFNGVYQFLPLNWTQIDKIAVQLMKRPPMPPMPLSNSMIYIDELKYRFELDTIPPLITSCPTARELCINKPLPSYVTDVVASDGIITQSPIAGTIITADTEITITATDNSQNSSTCKFNVKVLANSSSTISISSCGSYFSPAGNILTTSGIYNEVIPNHKGCDSLITINLSIVQPTTPTNISISKNNICNNETITLSATCGVGTPTWSGDMYFINPSEFAGTGTTIQVKPRYTHKYYVRCEGNGCTSNGAETPLITVDKIAPNSPTLSATNTNVCSGSNVNLSSTCSEGGIKWFNGSTQSIISVIPKSDTLYKAVCINAGGCSSDSAQISLSIINLGNEVPTLTLISTPKTCAGGDVQFQATGCSTGYIRFSNGVQHYIGTSTSPTTMHFYPTQTTYYKIACTDLTCRGNYGDSLKVEVVNDSLKAPIVSSFKELYCEGESITLSVDNCVGGEVTWYKQNGSQTSYYYGSQLTQNAVHNTPYQVFCSVSTCKSDTSTYLPKVAMSNWITNIRGDLGALCNGGGDNIRFTLNTTFPSDNIFTVELSDRFGSFENPTSIGTSTSANADAISVIYPAGLPYGNYYTRVVPSKAPDGVAGYKCFQSTYSVRLGVDRDVNFYKNVVSCENTALEISVGISDTENNISWYKDGIRIDSLNQSNRRNLFKRYFAKKSDEGIYTVRVINGSGCSFESLPFTNTIKSYTAPPTVKDTTIYRGNTVLLTATGCTGASNYGAFWYKQKRDNTPISSLVATNTNTYLAGGSISPGGISRDTTYYVACLDGCFSERVPVKISVISPVNAPNPPTLSVINNNACNYSTSYPTATATGCSGTVRWSTDPNFGYILETDTQAPYEFIKTLYNSGTATMILYADCVVNNIPSTGYSTTTLTTKMANGYITYPIVPFDEGYEDYERRLTIISGSDAKLKVQKPFAGYCNNGVFQWSDAPYNGTLLGTGETLTLTQVNTNIDIYVGCIIDGCMDLKQKISIIVGTEPNIGIVNNNQSVCGGGSTVINSTGCTNGTVNWYDAEVNGNLLFTGNNFTTPTYTTPSGNNANYSYWASCTYNSTTSSRKLATVIVTPVPSTPTGSDQTINCNSFSYIVVSGGCNYTYEYAQWYSAQGTEIYNYWGDYNGNKLYQENYTNASKLFYVSCKNRYTNCESVKIPINVTFDCTPPPPPIINGSTSKAITSQTTSSVLQVCANQEVILFTNSCSDGGVFWSDGGVGNYRKIYPTKSIQKLTATCTSTNYVTSNESNSISIEVKDSPKLVINNPPTSSNTVDITASSITLGSYLPINTQLQYYQDSLYTSIVTIPTAITQSGKYFIKAVSLNGCTDAKPVLVIINGCNSNIVLQSPNDNYSTGEILKKSSNAIQATNKISGTARVTYQSSKAVELKAGFMATPVNTGYSVIKIGGCSN